MKYTFRLTRPNSENETSIFCDINHKGDRQKYYTGQSTYSELWDQKDQMAKANKRLRDKYDRVIQGGTQAHIDKINVHLGSVIEAITSFKRQRALQEIPISSRDVKEHLNSTLGDGSSKSKFEFLDDYMEENYLPRLQSGELVYIKNNKRHRFASSTIKAKRQFHNALKAYQKEARKRLRMSAFNMNDYDEFVRWHEQKGISTNTIGRYVKELKAILRQAYDDGFHANRVFEQRAFKIFKEQTTKVYLSQEELNHVRNLELTGRDLKYRDLFLIGCYTALRFSDYSRIRPEHIHQENDRYFLKMVTQKTQEKVIIPLRPEVVEIIGKEGFFENKKVYEQKFNKAIKRLCKLAGIDSQVECQKQEKGFTKTFYRHKYELVTSHTARRTGATLMYLAEIPTIDIMKITGHKTEKAFLTYIRVSKEETAKRLMDNPFFRTQSGS